MYTMSFFFIHSSVNGYLGCFHVLSIVNIAAMNIGVHGLFELEILSFLNIYSVEGLLDHMVTLFLVFEGTSLLLSMYIFFYCLYWQVVLFKEFVYFKQVCCKNLFNFINCQFWKSTSFYNIFFIYEI